MAPGTAQGTGRVKHIALLGDSVFDNAAYVAGGPDVVQQVRAVLPPGWTATLHARDGSVISDMSEQLRLVPASTSHLVASVGGNDALREAHLLDRKVRSMEEALGLLATVRERFAASFGAMLEHMLQRRLPAAVCTIYEPRFPEPSRRRVAATALATLNDVVTREAFIRKIDCIDLRLICNEDRDFANPIEPSVHGGAKIAQAIVAFAELGAESRSRIITR